MGVFVHKLIIIIMPGLNVCGLQSKLLMDQFHVRPKKFNYSRLHMMSYPDYYSLGLLPLISMGKYIKIDSFHEAKCKHYVYVLLPEQQDTKI